ncbi:MAG: adenylate/guanylate cyclase domain-containing protein [Candidatus Competibacterales bacterium]
MKPNGDLTLAVMFVDICGSTRLFAEHGDVLALEMTTECIDELKVIVQRSGGRVVQTQGDGILCTFDRVDDAFQAAATIHETRLYRKLSIHAGLHVGPVIAQHGNVFGDAVNLAHRLVDLAKEDEILLSQDAVAHLSEDFHSQLRSLGKITLKGKIQPTTVHLVVTSEEDATQRCQGVSGLVPTRAYLELKYDAFRRLLRDPAPDFVIGRQEGCDLVVNHSYASRRHATIETRRGKFFLVDHSTNGTYVVDHNNQVIYLRRDVMQLSGSGYISLGSEPKQNDDVLLRYREAEELV